MNADYYNPYKASMEGPKKHTMYVKERERERLLISESVVFFFLFGYGRNRKQNVMMFNNMVMIVNRSPAVTGTSILGIKYDGGVMIAADTLGMTLHPRSKIGILISISTYHLFFYDIYPVFTICLWVGLYVYDVWILSTT